MTIKEFLETNKVEMKIQDSPENPNGMDSKEMFNYFFTLNFDGRAMTGYYSMGFGHVELLNQFNRPLLPNQKPKGNYSYEPKHKDVVIREFGGKGFLASQMDFKWRKIFPKVEDVLLSLISDAQTVESSRDFEEWADSLGYDTDSRKAERIYQACKEEAKKLENLFGRTLYKELLECEEE